MPNKPEWMERIPDEVLNSDLFRFNISLPNGKTFEVDVLADIDIDFDLIQEQLVESPSKFVYWSMIYSELKSSVALLESKIKTRKGILTKELILNANKGQKRITDKQLTTLIESDLKLKELENKYITAQRNTGKVYMVVEGLRMKCEALRSLAGFAKHEYQNL